MEVGVELDALRLGGELYGSIHKDDLGMEQVREGTMYIPTVTSVEPEVVPPEVTIARHV